jgi:hypothetical protein
VAKNTKKNGELRKELMEEQNAVVNQIRDNMKL